MKKWMLAAAGALVVVALAGCSTPAPEDSVPFSASEPSQASTPTPSSTPSSAPDVKPDSVAALDGMSSEEFHNLPVEQRVAYGQWYLRNMREYAAEFARASTNALDSNFPATISLDNSREELFTLFMTLQRAPFGVSQELDGNLAIYGGRESLAAFDENLFWKIHDSTFYNYASDEYANSVAQFHWFEENLGRGIGQVLGAKDLANGTHFSTRNTTIDSFSGVQTNNEYSYADFTSTSPRGTGSWRMVWVEYVDAATGQQTGTWVIG